MGLPESLRSEVSVSRERPSPASFYPLMFSEQAGSAFLSNLLEFASAPVGADLDDAADHSV